MSLRTLLALAASLPFAAHAAPAGEQPLPAIANAVSPEAGVVSAGRLAPEDIARVREAGIRHVIDLRPDAETPDFDEAAAVDAAGLAYDNLPVAGAADLTPATVQAFDALLRDAGRPVLVHCASGNRVGALAALRAAWVDGVPADEAIAIGKAWGLTGLEPAVRERLDAGQ